MLTEIPKASSPQRRTPPGGMRRGARDADEFAGMPGPPPPESDEALVAIDRVVLAITIESVNAVNYLDPANAT